MQNLFVFALSLILLSSSYADLKDMGINSVIPGSKQQFHGLRDFKTVLPGVLYRGGGAGGAKPMNSNQVEALCKAGFSKAGYLYPNGMKGHQSISCQSDDGSTNKISYEVYGFRPRNDRYKSLKVIHDVIQNRKGPVFMHCWNGWHASGEIAAIALIQFCGWSGKQAGDYWKANIGDKGNLGKYRSIYEKHIGGFLPFEDLKISAQEQERVCP